MNRKYVLLIVALAALGLLVGLLLYFYSANRQSFFLDDEYYGESSLIDIDGRQLSKLEEDKATFAVLVYKISTCGRASAYDFNKHVKEFLDINRMTFYQILYPEIEGTDMSEHVRVCPSVVIYREGRVVAFLDAAAAKHTEYYKSADNFAEWFTNYVSMKKTIKSE